MLAASGITSSPQLTSFSRLHPLPHSNGHTCYPKRTPETKQITICRCGSAWAPNTAATQPSDAGVAEIPSGAINQRNPQPESASHMG